MTTHFTVYMQPSKARDVHVTVHPDEHAHAHCSAYPDQTPILTVSHADISITVCPPGRSTVSDADLHFAQDLAGAATTYLAEITRLHTNPDTDADSGAESAEPAA